MTVQKGTTSVRVELQYVRNLGNYESLRVSIGVEDFVRDGETVDSATERVYEFVENKVVEKVGEMEKELKHG
jgi:ASC-1-like (ASCH) protein